MDALDADVLLRNRITWVRDDILSCDLCRRSCIYAGQVQKHVQGNEHQRRLFNAQFEADPVSWIPQPHREFVDIVNGWPQCTICKKFFDSAHMNSPKHIWWLNDTLAKIRPLSPINVRPPLPQPPPPPGDPSVGSAQNPPAVSIEPSTLSGAQKFCTVDPSGLLVDGDVPCHSVQGHLETASSPSQSFILDPSQLDPWQSLPSQASAPSSSSVNVPFLLPQPPPPPELFSFGCAIAARNMSIAVQTPLAGSRVLSMSSGAQTCHGVVSNGLLVDQM